MKRLILLTAVAGLSAVPLANAQEIFVLPSPSDEVIEPSENVVADQELVADQEIFVDQEIVADQQHEVSTYQQQEDAREESFRERRTRIAQAKGDQRRARLAYQKAIGVSSARPNVNPFAPMSGYSQTWFGGNAYAGPYNWVRKPSRYNGWPYYYGVHKDYVRN